VSTGIIILIVVILVLLAVGAVAASKLSRRKAELNDYGPEYDRLAKEVGPRKANAEFAKRRQRVESLQIRPLSAERRTAYTSQWEAAQEQFVDEPTQAVNTAGSLVTAVAVDRGYEAGDADQFLTDLSVHHGRHLDGYRHARQMTEQADRASTEDQRQALLDYRGIFFDLLEPGGDGRVPAPRPEPDEARGDRPQVEAQGDRPWKQLTQGRHWKTQRQDSDTIAEPRR
jgi:hypothetical protein